VRGVLEGAYNAGSGAVAKFEDLWPALQSTIGSVVSFMNASGMFKK